MLAMFSTQSPLAQAYTAWNAGLNVPEAALNQNRPFPYGRSYIATLTYANAIDFLKKDMEQAPYSYVGELFDLILHSTPAQATFRKLDQLGRYFFGDEAHTSKRAAFPSIPVQILLGGIKPPPLRVCSEGSVLFYATPRGPIIETVNITLALGNSCPWSANQKACIEEYLGSYIHHRSLLLPYDSNDTINTNTWNYTHSSTLIDAPWVLSFQGNLNLSNNFLHLATSRFDAAAVCVLDEDEKDTLILFGALGGGLVLSGLGLACMLLCRNAQKIAHADDDLADNAQDQPKERARAYPRYGSMEKTLISIR